MTLQMTNDHLPHPEMAAFTINELDSMPARNYTESLSNLAGLLTYKIYK